MCTVTSIHPKTGWGHLQHPKLWRLKHYIFLNERLQGIRKHYQTNKLQTTEAQSKNHITADVHQERIQRDKQAFLPDTIDPVINSFRILFWIFNAAYSLWQTRSEIIVILCSNRHLGFKPLESWNVMTTSSI